MRRLKKRLRALSDSSATRCYHTHVLEQARTESFGGQKGIYDSGVVLVAAYEAARLELLTLLLTARTLKAARKDGG